MSAVPYRPVHIGGVLETHCETRPDGTLVLRSPEPLAAYPARLTDRLEHWAAVAPERCFAARREAGTGEWVRVSYAQMLQRAQAVGEALAARGLSAERPVMILSDNDLDHLSLMLGGLWAGVPTTSVSPAYSIVAQDHGKLAHLVRTLTPGLVFASRGEPFARALHACIAQRGDDLEIVLGEGALEGLRTTAFAELLATVPAAAGARAHAAVGPDTVAKIMFTSGSTKLPKGVTVTQRMWCANQQSILQTLRFLGDEPPVVVDWLPWNHTFGGNHNLGLVLYNGGTLYIDDGRPTPQGLAPTLRNLKEIAPTIYFNVPKGYAELCSAMERDTELRDRFFSRLHAYECGGAGLSQATRDALDRHAEAATGQRLALLNGLGMTETAPSCMYARIENGPAGIVGLPVPGVEVKLVPESGGSGKTEVRFRGPNVTPGYWRDAAQTREAFDDEGYYRTGDAVKFFDAEQPQRGLLFDGRLAEDFKLSSGTFVSVGPLRAKTIATGDPLVQDVVVAGLDRDEIGLLVFPRVEDARLRFGLPAALAPAEVIASPEVRGFFQTLLDTLFAAGTGGATRPARLLVLAEPPSLDRGEVTDKGSINQRAVLLHRCAEVERLYANGDGVLLPQARR